MLQSGKKEGKTMKRIVMFFLSGLLLVPTTAWAESGKVRCTAAHYVRNGEQELQTTAIIFNNGDENNPVTIERITLWSFFGVVVHDSGPAIDIDHPVNDDFDIDNDITVVPPGATYYLRTNHIFGNDAIPPNLGGNKAGSPMAVVVEWSTKGKSGNFVVHVRRRARERVNLGGGNFGEGAETISADSVCFKLK